MGWAKWQKGRTLLLRVDGNSHGFFLSTLSRCPHSHEGKSGATSWWGTKASLHSQRGICSHLWIVLLSDACWVWSNGKCLLLPLCEECNSHCLEAWNLEAHETRVGRVLSAHRNPGKTETLPHICSFLQHWKESVRGGDPKHNLFSLASGPSPGLRQLLVFLSSLTAQQRFQHFAWIAVVPGTAWAVRAGG